MVLAVDLPWRLRCAGRALAVRRPIQAPREIEYLRDFKTLAAQASLASPIRVDSCPFVVTPSKLNIPIELQKMRRLLPVAPHEDY